MELDTKIFETLFEASSDPQYLLDLESKRYLKVNPAFERLTGYPRQDLEEGRVLPEDLVLPEDWSMVMTKREIRRQVPSDLYEVRVRCHDGSIKNLEIGVRRIEAFGDALILGSARDITARKRLEDRLKEEVQTQKRKTLEAAKASVRIYQLTEKIRNVPRMTAMLLDVHEEEALLMRAADYLVDAAGMNYSRCTLLFLEGERLAIKESRPRRRASSFPLAGKSRFAQVARDGLPFRGKRGEFVVPLRHRGEVLGVLEVCFDPEAKVLFDDSETVRVGQEDIVLTLANTIAMMLENLRLLERIRKQSIIDQLTQTFNRRHFDRKLAEEVRRAQRYGRALSLLMIDADYFKDVNDSWGHPAGDEVLAGLAQIFRDTSRDLDVVCRWGGDEFCILMPETTGESATLRAERLRIQVQGSTFNNPEDPNHPLQITISVGVADISSGDVTPGDLVRGADEALYQSKREGRNRVSHRSPLGTVPDPDRPADAAPPDAD